MSELNRRNFIKSSVLAASGVAVGSRALAGTTFDPVKKVITRTLGKTGLELPVLSMGVMRADNPNLVKAAYNSGIFHFDTANVYQKGNNELMLGEFFKDKPRDSFIIGTKVLPKGLIHETGLHGAESTEESFTKMFDTSLERLQMDHVDILYNHSVSTREGTLHEPSLNAMLKAKQEGKTRFIGLSTHSNQAEVILAAIESGLIDVVLLGYNFKNNKDTKLQDALEEGNKHGIGFIGMKNLAGGFHDKEKTMPVNGKAALKWVLQNPNITTCIPGFTTFDQLDEDLGVMTDLEMTEDEISDLQLGDNLAGLYCIGCNVCRGQCKNNLPVPDLMRAYMYSHGYRMQEKARYVLDNYLAGSDPCTGCNSCTVSCTEGFRVDERIAYVSRLKDVPEDFIV
ncbi:aldo/keto reductase [Bacteroidota bacterium]